MNDIIILRTALIVESSPSVAYGEERIMQYIEGLHSFFNFFCNSKLKDKLKIVILDNTLTSKELIDNRILNEIKGSIDFFLCNKNQYGKLNKGAGLIEAWNFYKEELLKYRNIIHFEPRLNLLNFNFFNSFFINPRNLFTINTDSDIFHFNTGLFSIDSKILLDFCNSIDLNNMIDKSISIEYLLYDFMIKNKIKFDIEKEMGVVWCDIVANKKRIM